jgi:glycosyltransferase involved in cell wall biosynthesis
MEAGVSCIIPCRNGQAYLLAAIASAVAEGVDEVIVVDDGSTDASAAIAQSACGPVRVLCQAGQGASAARNAGLAVARHGLIAFLDADDLWPAGSMTLRRQALAAEPALDAVYGHVQQFHSPELDAQARSRLICSPGSLAARTFGSIVFRHRVFDRLGTFDVNLGQGEMFDFMARFSDAQLTISCLPDIVLLRRIHGANMMHPSGGGVKGYPRALKAILDRRRLAQPRA